MRWRRAEGLMKMNRSFEGVDRGTEEAPSQPLRRRLVRAATSVALILIIIGMIWLGFGMMGFSRWAVSSPSMVPELNVGDQIVVQAVPFDQLVEGDIIVFHNPIPPPPIIVHRVYEVINKGGEIEIVTKGDANRHPDPFRITENEYIGKVIFEIPYGGLLALWLEPPINYAIIAIMLAIIFIMEFSPSSKKSEMKGNE